MAWCCSNPLKRSAGSVAVGAAGCGAWPMSDEPANPIAMQTPRTDRTHRCRVAERMNILQEGRAVYTTPARVPATRLEPARAAGPAAAGDARGAARVVAIRELLAGLD